MCEMCGIMDYKWRVELTYNTKGIHPGMKAAHGLFNTDEAKNEFVKQQSARKDISIKVINLEDLGAL